MLLAVSLSQRKPKGTAIRECRAKSLRGILVFALQQFVILDLDF